MGHALNKSTAEAMLIALGTAMLSPYVGTLFNCDSLVRYEPAQVQEEQLKEALDKVGFTVIEA